MGEVEVGMGMGMEIGRDGEGEKGKKKEFLRRVPSEMRQTAGGRPLMENMQLVGRVNETRRLSP